MESYQAMSINDDLMTFGMKRYILYYLMMKESPTSILAYKVKHLYYYYY